MSRKNEKAKTLLTIVQQCEEWESWDKMAKEIGLQSEVRARAKYTVNYRHKNKYPVSVMCRRCPELASVLLYIVWRCRRKMRLWRNSLRKSRNAASVHMATGGYVRRWRDASPPKTSYFYNPRRFCVVHTTWGCSLNIPTGCADGTKNLLGKY